jgi:beta-glucanase (GH16 family)
MLFNIHSYLLLLLLCLNTSCSEGDKDEWSLVWSDEFNTDGIPDPEKWSFVTAGTVDWNRYCTGDETTAFVKNGVLTLKGFAVDSLGNVSFKTGGIRSQGKFSFRYGKMEVRAKLGKAKGSWPAIWLMPQENHYGGWPYSGEIDVMEHLNFDAFVYQTVHSEYVDVLKKKSNPAAHGTAVFREGEFNTFGFEWYPDRLEFNINGSVSFIYPKIEGEIGVQWPFDQEFYIILNQALGGNWVGEVNKNDLPVEMQVDWVRVFTSEK